MFEGFSKEAIKFLKDLKANNNREWFTEHKKVYETEVKGPAQHFCDEMSTALQKLTGAPHGSKVFRIHRDVRFSKDKTPYNAHLHISFFPVEGADHPPHWFFGLDPTSLTVGVGNFMFEKGRLESFRRRVDGKEGATLAKTLAKLEKGGVRLGRIDLKRVPAPYDKDHPQGDLLRRKGLSAWVDFKDTKPATSKDVIKTCAASFKKIKPVYDWLSAL